MCARVCVCGCMCVCMCVHVCMHSLSASGCKVRRQSISAPRRLQCCGLVVQLSAAARDQRAMQQIPLPNMDSRAMNVINITRDPRAQETEDLYSASAVQSQTGGTPSDRGSSLLVSSTPGIRCSSLWGWGLLRFSQIPKRGNGSKRCALSALASRAVEGHF